jgi:hypothetical protein
MRWCAAIILLWPFTVMSQVANDDIGDRSNLILGAEPVISNTDHNTVEWACLDKKLTEKCLVYHNDQWFTFHVEKSGDYFINIASQKCRDGLGVQLIIIEGNPCVVSTYRVMECIRRIDQGEVSVALKGLKANASYLINVDGFQGDFCEFKIQLSSTPFKPKNRISVDSLEATAKRMNRVAELFWELKDDSANNINGFNIYRQREGTQQKELIREMSLGTNAMGATATKYTISDTLPGYGTYKFDVYGVLTDGRVPILLAEHRVTWNGKYYSSSPPPPPKTIAIVPLTGRTGAHIELVLLDDTNPSRLWTRKLIFDPNQHTTFQLDLEPWLKQGKTRFLMLAVDEEKREPVEYYFTTDRSGNIIRE